MIQAVKEIGDTILKRDKKTPLSTLIQNPEVENVFAIIFRETENEFEFSEVKIEEFDNIKLEKYLYRGVKGSGTNITPTWNFTELEKTIRRINIWINKTNPKTLKLNEAEKLYFLNLIKAFKQNKEQIFKQISEFDENLKESKIVTIKIINLDSEKYIGDISAFKNLLLKKVTAKNLKVSGSNKVCSLCDETKDSVFELDLFKFYTTDKPGFISSGFILEDAWKNYPVCNECKLSTEEGKKFVDKRKFNFYGLYYYLIPKFMVGDQDVKANTLELIEEVTREEQKLSDRDKKEIERREERILRNLGQANDYITFNFLFLKKENSAERILLLIEDVLPSRIRLIFKKIDEVNNLFGEKFKFNFGRVRKFFEKSVNDKKKNDLDKYFLEIVDKTFKGGTLNFHFMLKVMMNRIRRSFALSDKPETKDQFFFDVRDAILNTIFFEKLKLTNFKEVSMSTESFSNVFEKYGKSFSRPEARGIFLLGSLTELLLKKQYKEKKSRPFNRQLQGLKLNERDIRGLLPKVQNKLEEYKAFDKGKKEIAEAISYYLLEAGTNWKITNDEINFYLASGMNLVNEIANVVYEKHEINEEEADEQQ